MELFLRVKSLSRFHGNVIVWYMYVRTITEYVVPMGVLIRTRIFLFHVQWMQTWTKLECNDVIHPYPCLLEEVATHTNECLEMHGLVHQSKLVNDLSVDHSMTSRKLVDRWLIDWSYPKWYQLRIQKQTGTTNCGALFVEFTPGCGFSLYCNFSNWNACYVPLFWYRLYVIHKTNNKYHTQFYSPLTVENKRNA